MPMDELLAGSTIPNPKSQEADLVTAPSLLLQHTRNSPMKELSDRPDLRFLFVVGAIVGLIPAGIIAYLVLA